MKCIFCNAPITICQIEASKVCEKPICYACLEVYWKLNKYHCVNTQFMPDGFIADTIRDRLSKTTDLEFENADEAVNYLLSKTKEANGQ